MFPLIDDPKAPKAPVMTEPPKPFGAMTVSEMQAEIQRALPLAVVISGTDVACMAGELWNQRTHSGQYVYVDDEGNRIPYGCFELAVKAMLEQIAQDIVDHPRDWASARHYGDLFDEALLEANRKGRAA